MSSSESVRSWFVYLGHMSVINPGPYLSVLQSCWNLNVWNRKEVFFLSSVSRYLGLSIVCTYDLEYCSVVLCGLHWYFPGVRGVGENKITIEFVAFAGVFLWCGSQAASRGSISGWKPRVTSAPGPLRKRQPLGALSIRFVGAWCSYCEGSFQCVSSNFPDGHHVNHERI